MSGLIDINLGFNVQQRSSGEYVVCVEENQHGRILMYRWRPDGVETRAPVPRPRGAATFTRSVLTLGRTAALWKTDATAFDARGRKQPVERPDRSGAAAGLYLERAPRR